ncbi:MAG: hypothetical protein LHV68_09855 [Elusimicrobia bacterium]|nr:hypothetical protein [Candidatus Liberimonas magnetica]
MIKSEIEEKVSSFIGIKGRASVKLKEFIDRGLIVFSNQAVREGRIYSLSETGRGIALEVAESGNFHWQYSEPVLDWRLYGSIVCGRRKRKILHDIVEKGRITTILKHYHIKAELLRDTPRSYRYKILNDFLKSGVVQKIIEKGVPVYVPTEKARELYSLIFAN